ncbi:hypothetical protein BDZ85DRAFT_108284 [Elsinoe ampelina]|uniref:Uncharacterized protein n=1 Tax=Elsinoe ampelina TaxID=302913 RepID=A0A6A6GCA9_9PEZI|nr:hypothetical protein BDZ85DRAFT_108284 [Elsinoe ampelina]
MLKLSSGLGEDAGVGAVVCREGGLFLPTRQLDLQAAVENRRATDCPGRCSDRRSLLFRVLLSGHLLSIPARPVYVWSVIAVLSGYVCSTRRLISDSFGQSYHFRQKMGWNNEPEQCICSSSAVKLVNENEQPLDWSTASWGCCSKLSFEMRGKLDLQTVC